MTEENIKRIKDLIEWALEYNNVDKPEDVDALLRDVLALLTKEN